VSPRAVDGDRWDIRVTFGGARLEVGGQLPVETSLQQAVLLLADGMSALLRQLKDEADHQKRMAEEELGG